MTLEELMTWASDKHRFMSIDDFSAFCEKYLSFIKNGLQAVIVSQNEQHYRFFQYKEDGAYNVSRPINSELMIVAEDFEDAKRAFGYSMLHIREIEEDSQARENFNRFIYTCQQSIGATLDALPTGRSNVARKINGDLFERFIRMLLQTLGIEASDGYVQVPVCVDGVEQFKMCYQHDLIIERNSEIKAIGSVKTSSKDRIDKVFIDKFLYNRLTDSNTPHFAVFLNDVQRRGTERHYGVNTTFLTGHFKGYTVKLNPLDGVYYCDLRPNMKGDLLLKQSIRTLDCLFVTDIWGFLT